MSGENKAILIGNVGKDPEIRTMQSGDKVARFSLATNEKWKDKKTGELKNKTQWHNVVVMSQGLVKTIEQYVTKGKKLYIIGTIEYRSYEKDGETKYTTEIVLKSYDSKLILLSGNASNDDGNSEPALHNMAGTPVDDLEDEIPF